MRNDLSSETTAPLAQRVPYLVPSGWVESYTADNGFRLCTRFHIADDCPWIRSTDLRPVQRPGSAARCRHCAPPD